MKRLNKKGQFTAGQLLGLILGAVAVIIVIIGFTQGWSFFTDIFKQADVDIAIMSQKCEVLASTGSAGYFSDRIEIKTNSYVNCPYAIKSLGANITSNPPTMSDEDAGAKAICNKLKLEESQGTYEKVKVNNKLCSVKEPEGWTSK